MELFELEPDEPVEPKPKRTYTGPRIAPTLPYSQPRHPRWDNHPITRLERKILNSNKHYRTVASEAGINPSLLSQIAHGRKGASAEVLMKLSLYFHCDPKELVGYE